MGVGQQLVNLNEIAAAGGTNQAYLVGATDVTGQVLAALNKIRGLAQIPCELQIPPPPAGQSLDFHQVNVGYCSAAGQSRTFFYVDTASRCDPREGGWYYDDPSKPTQISLCGATCDQVSAPGGSLFMSVGCATLSIR